MLDAIEIGKMAPNFVTVGVYKNRLGKIRLSDYHGKKYVILFFYPAQRNGWKHKVLRRGGV